MNRNTDFARTKIIGTLGPASDSPGTIGRMLDAGLDVVRLNCSHSSIQDLDRMIKAVRKTSEEKGIPVAILADLSGPKIRLAELPGEVEVSTGDVVVLTADPDYRGTAKIPAGYPGLAEDLDIGNRILIDDGLIQLEVISIEEQDVNCRVLNDGVLKSHKGINLPDAAISLSCLTDKDRSDIEFLVTREIDFIALSFVRSAADIRELRKVLKSHSREIPVVAKIEKPEAVSDLENIVAETDVVMVARGDLGVELPAHEVPLVQKRIITLCNERNKPVITATQMLESMIGNPRPTRAEASDVANAVLDGTDAVMLSGETAVGQYPVETVQMMERIIRSAESQKGYSDSGQITRNRTALNFDESVSRSACRMAEENQARIIICLTKGGRTARLLSRFRSHVPIIAFTESMEVVRYLNIVWGVQGELIQRVADTDSTLEKAAVLARKLGYADAGDTVVFTAGIPLTGSAETNMLKIERV